METVEHAYVNHVGSVSGPSLLLIPYDQYMMRQCFQKTKSQGVVIKYKQINGRVQGIN